MGSTQRVAVVTGAASGMGLAIARHLAARGDHVGLLDLQGDAALRAAAELRETGATVIAVEADVTDRGAVDAALDKVRAKLGPIQIMVTSAGLDAFHRFADITIETWERVLAINLTGTFHCLQAAVPDMLEARWGRIVTISSSSAQSGAPRPNERWAIDTTHLFCGRDGWCHLTAIIDCCDRTIVGWRLSRTGIATSQRLRSRTRCATGTLPKGTRRSRCARTTGSCSARRSSWPSCAATGSSRSTSPRIAPSRTG
jgi:NAD(P)-dependent dehydrogenase (short-subunit alcohol dehydrogenase family)